MNVNNFNYRRITPISIIGDNQKSFDKKEQRNKGKDKNIEVGLFSQILKKELDKMI